MERSGVFGALSLAVPAAHIEDWKRTRIVRPRTWPAPLRSNTEYLPDFGGVLPDEIVITGSDPAAQLTQRGYTPEEIAERELIPGGLRVITHGEVRHPSSVSEVILAIRSSAGSRLVHSVRASGEIEVDAYFADYGRFVRWFDAFALMCIAASQLGGSGEGVFLADDDCAEPVVFVLRTGREVEVDAVDAQNARPLYERWAARMRDASGSHAL